MKALEGGPKTLQAVNGIGPKRASTLAELFKEGSARPPRDGRVTRIWPECQSV